MKLCQCRRHHRVRLPWKHKQQIHSAATVQCQDWWLHKQGPCFVFREDLTWPIINTSARVLEVVTRGCWKWWICKLVFLYEFLIIFSCNQPVFHCFLSGSSMHFCLNSYFYSVILLITVLLIVCLQFLISSNLSLSTFVDFTDNIYETKHLPRIKIICLISNNDT